MKLSPTEILDVLKWEGDLDATIAKESPTYIKWAHSIAHSLRIERIENVIYCGRIYNEALFSGYTSRKQYLDFFSQFPKHYDILLNMLDSNVDNVTKGLWDLCRPYAETIPEFKEK